MNPAKPLRQAWNWISFVIGIGLGLLVGIRVKTAPTDRPGKPQSAASAPRTAAMPSPQRHDDDFDAATLRRALDGRATAIARLEQQVADMRDEYMRLTEKYQHSQSASQDAERVAFFRSLEPVLVQLPVMAFDLRAGADISAKDVLDLALTVPRSLRSLEIKMFGDVGSRVSYNPQLHRPSPSSRSLAAGDPARIVVPGFAYREEILTRAEVMGETS